MSQQISHQTLGFIFNSSGFDLAEPFTFELLEESIVGYLRKILNCSKSLAELSNRDRININDITASLTQSGVYVDTLCSEMVDRRAFFDPHKDRFEHGLELITEHTEILESKEQEDFFRDFEDIPQLQDLLLHEPLPFYIPEHFPVFPPMHTYRHSSAYMERTSDFATLLTNRADETRQAEAEFFQLLKHIGVAPFQRPLSSTLLANPDNMEVDSDPPKEACIVNWAQVKRSREDCISEFTPNSESKKMKVGQDVHILS